MPISNYLRSIREKVGHDLVALTAVSISSSTMKLACCSAGTPKRGSGHFPAVRSTLTNIPPTLRCVNVLKKPVSSFDRKQSSGSLAVPNSWPPIPMGTSPTTRRLRFWPRSSVDRTIRGTARCPSCVISQLRSVRHSMCHPPAGSSPIGPLAQAARIFDRPPGCRQVSWMDALRRRVTHYRASSIICRSSPPAKRPTDGSRRTIRKALPSNIRCKSEPLHIAFCYALRLVPAEEPLGGQPFRASLYRFCLARWAAH